VFSGSQVEVKIGKGDCKLNERVGINQSVGKLTRINLGNGYCLLNLPTDSNHFLWENTSEFIEYLYVAVRTGPAPFLPVWPSENSAKKRREIKLLMGFNTLLTVTEGIIK
jgi:hypothetical protein